MSNLARKPPLGLKDKSKKQKDPRYLDEIRQRKCIVCQTHGEIQMSPTTAHHVIHDRYGTRKRSDRDTIPLCSDHHQGLFNNGNGKIAIHKNPKKWRDLYGPDWSYLDHPTEP